MRILLRVSVLLPVMSLFVLGLTRYWQNASVPTDQIPWLGLAGLIPAAWVYFPGAERRLRGAYLPASLGVYLICQSLLNGLLHNWGLLRNDMVQIGSLGVVDPGILLIVPPLLIAWQYGWLGALSASAAAGTIHMLTGAALHLLFPSMHNLTTMRPILRPDVLYFLPLLIAYLGILVRRQQRSQTIAQSQWREYAAAAEIAAAQRERRHLARALQGDLQQPLALLNDQIAGLAAQWPAQAEAAGQFQEVKRQAQRTRFLTEEIIDTLQSPPLHDMALLDAIHLCVDKAAERHAWEVEMETVAVPDEMTDPQAAVLFYAVEQAMAHCARAEGVEEVNVRLAVVDRTVALTVHDDGVHRQQTDDLDSLHACVELIGGYFHWDAQAVGGNTLAVWLPCGKARAIDGLSRLG